MRLIAGVAAIFAALALAVPAHADTGPATTTAGSPNKQRTTLEVPAPPSRPLIAAATICLNAHLQDIGWQGWVCGQNGGVATVGTTGQSRRMEALAVTTFGAGGVCAQAHVQDLGWLSQVCVADGAVAAVGTTGQSRRMEALGLGSPGSTTCAEAHLQDIGWQGARCAGPGVVAFVGTTGQSRRMEALRAWLP
ncbi:hypothetical protein [Lentzea tibetensis]|uniref:hypothetical protein n=1 Tax=Lentzea tibetensis TaxID=2591470 RepID=UPI001C99667E|nr:hypothetical protein [Lentzea tibetensis]